MFSSKFNTVIGLASLGTQLFILLPWHETISTDIKTLKKELKIEIKNEINKDIYNKTEI